MGAKKQRAVCTLRKVSSLLLLLAIFGQGDAVAQAPSPAGGKRIALVIGNTRYPDAGSPIPTALGDARSIAEELRRDGFEVDEKQNANRDTMRRAIDAFLAKIRPASGALLYFSGFGIQSARQSYLVPN
jgi:uncharacterized caspase-like protein